MDFLLPTELDLKHSICEIVAFIEHETLQILVSVFLVFFSDKRIILSLGCLIVQDGGIMFAV